MATPRALLPFAVVVAFAACTTHSLDVEAQAATAHDTVTITVDADQLQSFLEEEERSPVPVIETNPDPFHLKPGQEVSFTFDDGSWMVQPQPLSPFDRVVIHGDAGETVTVRVRGDAMKGVYKSIIAVYFDGRVFVTDPHFIIS